MFVKVNEFTIKTTESPEVITAEIKRVIESLSGKVKMSTPSEIEASFRYGINFYGITVCAKIYNNTDGNFVDIKGYFKDSIDNGAAASKAAEILNILTDNTAEQAENQAKSKEGNRVSGISNIKMRFQKMKTSDKFFVALFILLIFNILYERNGSSNSSTSNFNKGSYGASAAAEEGLSKTEWYARCKNFARSRDECAVSAKLGQCIDIKMGEYQANMAAAYCDGASPKFHLIGIK